MNCKETQTLLSISSSHHNFTDCFKKMKPMHISISTLPRQTSLHPKLPLTTYHRPSRTSLHSLLTFFQSSSSLPPSQPTNHYIHLLPNSEPVNVRPYCYLIFRNRKLKHRSIRCYRRDLFVLTLVLSRCRQSWSENTMALGDFVSIITH